MVDAVYEHRCFIAFTFFLKSVPRTLQRRLTSPLRWQLEHVLSSFHLAFNMRLSSMYQHCSHLPLSLTQLPHTAQICMDTASPLATLALSMPFCERVQPGRMNDGELPSFVLLHVPRHQLVSVLVQWSMLVHCSSLKHSLSNSSLDLVSLWQSINCSSVIEPTTVELARGSNSGEEPLLPFKLSPSPTLSTMPNVLLYGSA